MPQVYPPILLPQSNYKLIDESLSEEYLIRYVYKSTFEESLVSDDGMIGADKICSPKERIQDLSVSLLGHYLVEYTKIELSQLGKKIYAPYCNPDFVIDEVPVHPEHFVLDDSKSYWGIKIGDINDMSFNIKLGEEDALAVCYIAHTPTVGNFWHFSIRWNVDGKPIEDLGDKEKKKISTKIGANARALLRTFIEINIIDNDGIPSEYYVKADNRVTI